MFVVIGVSMLFFVVGFLLWALVDPTKAPTVKEAGRLLFFAGALGLCIHSSDVATAFGIHPK